MTSQEQELFLLTNRVIELENRLNKQVDYSKVIADLHQKIFGLEEKIKGWEAVQKNVNARIEACGLDIAKLQAHNEKPRYFWDWMKK